MGNRLQHLNDDQPRYHRLIDFTSLLYLQLHVWLASNDASYRPDHHLWLRLVQRNRQAMGNTRSNVSSACFIFNLPSVVADVLVAPTTTRPYMATIDIEHEYVFVLDSSDTICNYAVIDAQTMDVVAVNSTKQSLPAPGDSYFFSLYFGGEVR